MTACHVMYDANDEQLVSLKIIGDTSEGNADAAHGRSTKF